MPPVTKEECHDQHRELTEWLRRIEDGNKEAAKINGEKLDRILAGQAANSERIARLEEAKKTSWGLMSIFLSLAGLIGGLVAWIVGLIPNIHKLQ